MQAAHRRHDISDKICELFEPHPLAPEAPEALLSVTIEIFSMRFLILRTGAL